jgi:hypothetical protein
MSLNHATFLTVVRASAACDLLLTVPFATPWTFAFAHAQLSAVNRRLAAAPCPVSTRSTRCSPA